MSSEDREWLEAVWEKLKLKMEAECGRIGDKIPYIPDNGSYEDMGEKNIAWWTNGFWPGMLWQMYAATGKTEYRETAERVEERLNRMFDAFVGMDHDTGFLWLLSAVADYRLTGSQESFVRGLHAANILAGRFNPAGGFIRAWGSRDGRHCGWMIIDCLMNLPLLYWASDETGDPRYEEIAGKHTDTALRHLFRQDGSVGHIASVDAQTGELLEYPDCQGFSPDSAWSRGQAWALYGMTLAARHTGNADHLDIARRCAHYFLACVSQTNYVPLCDFRAPEEPVIYDTSAGACAACGLLELAGLTEGAEAKMYRDGAMKILRALEERHCDWNPEKDSMLSQGCVAYHGKQQDVPLIYADYFWVEAITRLLGNGTFLW